MDNFAVVVWHAWVKLFIGLPLPWSATATATAAAVVGFYFVGIALNLLTAKER